MSESPTRNRTAPLSGVRYICVGTRLLPEPEPELARAARAPRPDHRARQRPSRRPLRPRRTGHRACTAIGYRPQPSCTRNALARWLTPCAWQYTVKKVFTLGVRREQRHTKRLGYQNPYTEDLRLSIHTDHPHLLTLPKLNYVSLLGCKGTGAKRQLTRCCCVCARSSRPNSARLSSCSSSRSRATGQRATRRSECGSTTRARTKTKSKPAWLPLLFLTIVTRGVFAQVHRLQRQLFDGVRG